jgi:methionyl-tRNA formyltransferase
MARLEFGMIAGETSRSEMYIDSLVEAGLEPSHVIVLRRADASGSLPGQVGGGPNQGLVERLRASGLPFEIVPSTDINSEQVIDAVRNRPEETLIYSGYGGAILRSGVLGTGKRFLHVHGGYLPDFKGSTTNYYSLIERGNCGASAIFLTADLDGGPVLLRRTFSAPADRTRMDHGYDAEVRASVLIEVLEKARLAGGFEELQDVGHVGEMYYVIHPVLKHLAILADRHLKR